MCACNLHCAPALAASSMTMPYEALTELRDTQAAIQGGALYASGDHVLVQVCLRGQSQP